MYTPLPCAPFPPSPVLQVRVSRQLTMSRPSPGRWCGLPTYTTSPHRPLSPSTSPSPSTRPTCHTHTPPTRLPRYELWTHAYNHAYTHVYSFYGNLAIGPCFVLYKHFYNITCGFDELDSLYGERVWTLLEDGGLTGLSDALTSPMH